MRQHQPVTLVTPRVTSAPPAAATSALLQQTARRVRTATSSSTQVPHLQGQVLLHLLAPLMWARRLLFLM
jgi:hypothetical protein